MNIYTTFCDVMIIIYIYNIYIYRKFKISNVTIFFIESRSGESCAGTSLTNWLLGKNLSSETSLGFTQKWIIVEGVKSKLNNNEREV